MLRNLLMFLALLVQAAPAPGQSAVMAPPVKALLLVSAAGAWPSVWNDFSHRYFGNRCPVVYGGVVVDEDAANPVNSVHCYRLAAGHPGQPAASPPTGGPVRGLAAQLRTALRGITSRHPGVEVVIVSQGLPAALAGRRLAADDGRPRVVAVLALVDGRPGLGDKAARTVPTLVATPGQSGKIGRALSQLLPFWW